MFISDSVNDEVWGAPAQDAGWLPFSEPLAAPAGLVVADGLVFIADPGGRQIAVMAARGGGTPAAFVARLGEPLSVAADAQRLYWADHGDADAGVGGSVSAVWLSDGGAAATLASGASPLDLAVDGTGVYWVDDSLEQVGFAPLDGGPGISLGSTQGVPEAIALDGSSVFWTTASGSVFGMDKSGASPVALAQGENRPLGVVSDGTSLYFADHASDGGGSVRRIPVDGGLPDTLLSGGSPGYLALGGACLYVTDSSRTPAVVRTDK